MYHYLLDFLKFTPLKVIKMKIINKKNNVGVEGKNYGPSDFIPSQWTNAKAGQRELDRVLAVIYKMPEKIAIRDIDKEDEGSHQLENKERKYLQQRKDWWWCEEECKLVNGEVM